MVPLSRLMVKGAWFGLSNMGWSCCSFQPGSLALHLPVYPISRHNRSSSPQFFLLAAAGFLVASLIWYLLLIFLYSLFIRALWREVPKSLRWILPPKSRQAILYGWVVTTLAVLVGAAPFLILAFYSSDLILETMRKRGGIEPEQVIGKIFPGWYVTAAYLYQAKSLFRQRTRKTEN